MPSALDRLGKVCVASMLATLDGMVIVDRADTLEFLEELEKAGFMDTVIERCIDCCCRGRPKPALPAGRSDEASLTWIERVS